MNRFVACDCAPSSPEGAKMLACAHPAFDGSVVLFQNVIKILHSSMAAFLFLAAPDGSPRPRLWSESARPPLHHVWPREGSRSSHRWSPRRGTSTPICLSPARTSRPPAQTRLLS